MVAALIEERCLHVTGELDAFAAPQLLRELGSTEGLVDSIDLSGLTFIDSSGLAAIITIHRRYPKVPIHRPSPVLEQLMRLAGVPDDMIFPATASTAHATSADVDELGDVTRPARPAALSG